MKPNMASKVEALQKSFGIKDTMLQPFIDSLRKVHVQGDQNETNRIAMECEKKFGDRMFNPFFKLHGMYYFTCCLLMLHLANLIFFRF